MDNKREIVSKSRQTTDLVERSKLAFLRETVRKYGRKQDQYDLEREFARTKQNRSWFVPFMIAGLIAVCTIAVIGVTWFIQSRSRDITIEVDDFAGVNLREILDEAQRLQDKLDAVKSELGQVIDDRDRRIAAIERERDQAVSLLTNAELTPAQLSARTRQINAQAAAEIEAVTAEAAARAAELEGKIDELNVARDQYDTRQLEQASAQAEILDNERKVFELQLQETINSYESRIATLTDRYEAEIADLEQFQTEFERALRARKQRETDELILRYNPDVGGEEVERLLDLTAAAPVRRFDELAPYTPTLDRLGILTPDEYAALQERCRELAELVERLDAVPYRNSVPPILEALDTRLREVVLGYETIWTSLNEAVVQRDELIEDFRFALDELTSENGDTGYILDPRDPDNVIMFVGQIHPVAAGSVAYVFRTDDTYVGLIEFYERDGRLAGRVVQTAPNMELCTFDKVLVQVQ